MKKRYIKALFAGAVLASLIMSLSGCGEITDAFKEGFEEGYNEALEENGSDSSDDIEVVTPEEAGLVATSEDGGQNTGVQASSSKEDWGITDDMIGGNGSPQETVSEDEAGTEGDAPTLESAVEPTGEFNFTSKDINGNDVSLADYSGYKVIMVNFWEPWCGPCVGEMPELEELYEEYNDEGFLILGIYSDNDSDAKEIVDEAGITYPVVKYISQFDKYQSGYVPNTIFINGNGDVLTDEPYVGANSKEGWEEIIKGYLGD